MLSISRLYRIPVTKPPLCAACSRIDLEDGCAHHTLEGLRKSAAEGCPCCEVIAGTLIGAKQVGSTNPVERLREYRLPSVPTTSEESGRREERKSEPERRSQFPSSNLLSRLIWRTEPMSVMRSEPAEKGPEGNPQPPYYAKSSISVDKRRNVLFYTVYDCESPERKSREPGKLVRRLELCQVRGDPYAEDDCISSRLLEDSASSCNILDLAKSWINSCIQQHQNCRQGSVPLPTRVLDLSEERPVLIETDGRHGSYVLLSHCWGRKPTLKATKASLVDLYQGIRMEDLPKTFYDAVVITRGLGVRYLWIDSLCIVQDLPEDWTSEAARMRDYYKGGYLTISALFSSDSHCGILNPRQLSQALLVHEQNLYLRAPLPEQPYILRTAPLSSRAWVMQERLLSTRILHYGDKEVFWECLTCSARESSTKESTGKADPHSTTTSESIDFKRILTNLDLDVYSLRAGAFATWCRLVTRYSRCALTYESDKLPAISGIASLIEKETDGTYIAGIWKEDIRSLLWMVDEDRPLAAKPRSNTTMPTPYLSPSWSWISASSCVTYNYDKHIPSVIDAEIISHHLTNPGGGLAGRLVLRASARDILLQRNGRRYNFGFGCDQCDHIKGPDFAETFLYGKLQEWSRWRESEWGPGEANIIGKGFMDSKAEIDALESSIVECKALWIMRLKSIASLTDNSVIGVDHRAPLYCLLVVPVDTEGDLKTWRRIGVGIIRGSEVLSSPHQDFVLI